MAARASLIPARWFARTREYGVKPWLSIRMNDLHVAEDPTSSMHDALWRENSSYWRVGYREFESERDRGIDYGHVAVRQHYLDYIREMLGRYDVDALELDWSRQPWALRPGCETEAVELLNAFTADVRRMTESRGRSLGHRIELCVRVPSFPETALRMGFDAGAWARAGIVERIIPTPCFGNTDFDMPIEIWKQMLHGTNVRLAAGLECMMLGVPFTPLQFLTLEAARGAASTLLDRGADEIYLYNFMDRDTSLGDGTFDRIIRELGSLQTLAGKPRRHVLTTPNIWPQGGAPPFTLPYRLTHYGFRPSAEFRIPIGPAPRSGEPVSVGLGLSPADRPESEGRVVQAHGRKFHLDLPPATNEAAKQLVVRASGEICSFAGPAPDQTPKRPGPTHSWRVPEGALHRGDALIEVFNPAEEPLSTMWVEISIGKYAVVPRPDDQRRDRRLLWAAPHL